MGKIFTIAVVEALKFFTKKPTAGNLSPGGPEGAKGGAAHQAVVRPGPRATRYPGPGHELAPLGWGA